MTLAANNGKRLTFGLFLVAIYAIEFVALQSVPPGKVPTSLGPWVPLADLVILPLALYGFTFGWRRLGSSDWVPVAIVATGIAASRLAVPSQFRLGETSTLLAVIFVEVLIVAFAILKFRRIQKGFQVARAAGESLFTAIQTGLRETYPPLVAKYLTFEFSMVACTFAYGWVERSEGGGRAFSYTKRGALGTVYIVLGLLALIETIGVHWLLVFWLPAVWRPAIWALTALSVYALIYLIGDYRAMTAMPHTIREGHLCLRLGARWKLDAPLSQIAEVGPYRPRTKAPVDAVLCPRLSAPNLRVSFKESVQLSGLFGQTKWVDSIAIAVDDPAGVMAALAERTYEKAPDHFDGFDTVCPVRK